MTKEEQMLRDAETFKLAIKRIKDCMAQKACLLELADNEKVKRELLSQLKDYSEILKNLKDS